jgi:hypothetical protein
MGTIDQSAVKGRKVFFLYPHSVLNEDLLIEILSNEFEVHCLRDHDVAMRAAETWPGSIFFINIDEGLKEYQWESWIRLLVSEPATASTRVGIMTYNPDQELARKYLMDLMIPCGFIQLKLGLAEGTRIILRTLEANEARGRRRYVRARCADPRRATFNVSIDGTMVNGSILDISAAGMAIKFDSALPRKAGAHLVDMQLRLKGTLCRISGTLAGTVRAQPDCHLLMFDTPLDEQTTAKIHRFIFHTLQEEMGEFVRKQASRA